MSPGHRYGLGVLLASMCLTASLGAAQPSRALTKAQAQALTDSQQQVVQLNNQLQGLEARASQSQQVLVRQDQQIARLKAALARPGTAATAAQGH